MGMHKLASLGYPQEAITEVEIDSGPSTPCRMCSINDGMPKDLYSLTYITVDTAINYILTLGPGTLLAKVDIKSAFRVLPLHPANCHLLVMHWNKQLYIDTCLPFGLQSAPKLFNILADLLAWMLNQQGVSPVLHYLDDFLTMDQADSSTCHNNFTAIQHTYQKLDIPFALEKLEDPSHSLTFLGIEIDTIHMEAQLLQDKLSCISKPTNHLGQEKEGYQERDSLTGWVPETFHHTQRSLIAHPHASKFPTLLPATLTSLITPQQLDWISLSFRLHFQEAVFSHTDVIYAHHSLHLEH